MRLIDADALFGKKIMVHVDAEGEKYVALDDVREIIRRAPTICAGGAAQGVREEILREAIRHYGHGNQRLKAIEELSELIRALARCDDHENIAEEMADVRIMLDQLEIMLNNSGKVCEWELAKLKRLDERVHAADSVV